MKSGLVGLCVWYETDGQVRPILAATPGYLIVLVLYLAGIFFGIGRGSRDFGATGRQFHRDRARGRVQGPFLGVLAAGEGKVGEKGKRRLNGRSRGQGQGQGSAGAVFTVPFDPGASSHPPPLGGVSREAWTPPVGGETLAARTS